MNLLQGRSRIANVKLAPARKKLAIVPITWRGWVYLPLGNRNG